MNIASSNKIDRCHVMNVWHVAMKGIKNMGIFIVLLWNVIISPFFFSFPLLLGPSLSSIPRNWRSCTARLQRRAPSRSRWWPLLPRALSFVPCLSTRKLSMSLRWWSGAPTMSWAVNSMRVRTIRICSTKLLKVKSETGRSMRNH